MSRAVRVATILLSLAVLAGCSSTPSTGDGAGARLNAPRPVGVKDPAPIPSGSAGAGGSCDPRASLRPSGTLPEPGRMPGGSTMARIVQRGRLVVGVDQTNYLFGYRDAATGELGGFEISLAQEIARALFGDPDRIQLLTLNNAERIPAVRDGRVDLVIRSMTMTCERWQQVAFSTEYFSAGQRILVRADSTATSLADLAGQKVCAAEGSTSIRAIAAATPAPVPVSAANALDCLVLLQQNQIAAVSTDDSILAGFAAQDPNTKLVGQRFTEEPYGIAVAPGSSDLVRFVNGVLERLRADGTWTANYNRWLAKGLGTAPPPPTARYRD